jgi:RNA polymerase sigma factor (sigma-70 family)
MTRGISDGQLVARCRARDRDAWDELVERFSRYVYAICTRAYGLGRADAEEVFQEVFARTFERLGDLRDDEAIRPWIGQLTRRAAIDRLRSVRREQLVEEQPERAELDRTLATLDEAMSVREALLRLPRPCQEVLDRFFARDESYEAIGVALGIPAGTIASRISRCLEKLRNTLGAGTSGARHSWEA